MQSVGTIQRSLLNTAPMKKDSGEQKLRKFTNLSEVYTFIRLACKNVSSARGFLSVKWFTKDEIFTSCFNFDLNRSASMKKMCSKMSFLSLVKKVSPPYK